MIIRLIQRTPVGQGARVYKLDAPDTKGGL